MYDHLTEIADRRADGKLKRDFVALCAETWDEQRSACLTTATTIKDALACRPEKVHPG